MSFLITIEIIVVLCFCYVLKEIARNWSEILFCEPVGSGASDLFDNIVKFYIVMTF